MKKVSFDPLKDLAFVGIASEGPYVLVVNPSLNVKSFSELIAVSKAKPGTLNYASFGIGSLPHLNLEALNRRMGIDLVHVPYKGAAPAAQATVAGEVGVIPIAIRLPCRVQSSPERCVVHCRLRRRRPA